MRDLINPFPEHRRGLWAVRAEPYLFKDRWAEAPFGDRWQRLKERLRMPAVPRPAAVEMARAGAPGLWDGEGA